MSDERLNLPSASSFYADVACAGRQNLLRELRGQAGENAELESDEDKVRAERGTRIHDARRTWNTFQLQDESEVEAYNKACEIERRVVEDWMRDNNIAVVSDPIVEERLWLNHPETMQPILSGQTDVVYVAGQNALINDWKTSMAYYAGDVGRSWQTRVYALLIWKKWPQLKRIRVAFIKPEAFGPKQDVADFSQYDLKQIEQAVLHAIWKSQQPDAPLHAGVHCRFCAARGICKEAARYALLPTTFFPTDKKSIEALVATMQPEAALSVWQKRAIIKNIMEAIAARLTALPPEEHDRLGLKLTAGKKLDYVKDKVGAFNSLRASGYSSEQILACMEFGKTALVEMFKNERNMRDAEATAMYESGLNDFIERGRGKPSLVEN